MNKLIWWLLLAGAVNCLGQVKVSDLPAAPSVGLTDVLPVVGGGQTRKATIGQVADAVVGRENSYHGTFTGNVSGGDISAGNLSVSDGAIAPEHGPARVNIAADMVFGLRLHSDQSNGLLASSRNGQAAKFLQEGWDAETFETPVVRVARGIGGDGVNHSPLLMLHTAYSEWSDGDALLVRRDGADTFRLTADGFAHSAGLVLPQTADIPTNAIPAGSESVTNWMLLNLGGVPTFVATNHVAGGWLQKALWP